MRWVFEQGAVRFLGERPACREIARLRHVERRVDGIDAAHEIDMLRCRRERREFLAAERQEYAPRRFAERLNGVLDCRDFGPVSPACFFQAGRRSASNGTLGDLGGACGVGGNDGRIRMRRVDQRSDVFGAKIGGEALSAAEAAAPDRHGLRQRLGRAAGERQRHGEIGAPRQFLRERPRFGRAAEDKDFSDAR